MVREDHPGSKKPVSRFAPRDGSSLASPTPSVTRILHHVPVIALLADIMLLVVAVALRGVDGNARRAAGALVALVVVGNGLDGFGRRLRH